MAVVLHAAPEADDPDSFIFDDLVLNTVAAFRRVVHIVCIVVAMDIEQGSLDHCNQEGKILAFQISAGDDKVHSFKP